MSDKPNFTGINHLLPKSVAPSGHFGKETEPRLARPVDIEAPQSEPEPSSERSISPISTPPPKIEIIPDLPTVDEELQQEGVQLVDGDTIFVGSKKIDLPMPIVKVDAGLKKPLKSGWRWMAEITKYILARFHIVVKKIGGQFRLAETK